MDWGPATGTQYDRLFGKPMDTNANLSNTVFIFRLPAWVPELFARMEPQKMAASQDAYDTGIAERFPAFVDEVTEYLQSKVFFPFELVLQTLNFTRPGSASSTYDDSQKRYRGLHVDNWGTPWRGLLERDESGSRLGLNVGKSTRSFVFVNLTIARMLELYRDAGNTLPTDRIAACTQNVSPFTEKFMEDFTRYPVVRVSLEPGQAYLAPTQNILHDGYPVDIGSLDMNVQLSSNNFSPRPEWLDKRISA